MAQPKIEELLDNNRFPKGGKFILALLYSPFGIVLAFLRLFIGFHTFIISCLLPKFAVIRSVILRMMCMVLGIVVTTDRREEKSQGDVKLMVANYTSSFDHLAIDLIKPSIMPCIWDLPPTLMWMLAYVDMGAKEGREKLISNAKKHCRESKVPLLVFPEGASTNGKVGLLKFSAWPFSVVEEVHPLLVKIKRPFVADLTPSIIGGRWWRDIFWTFFVPYTAYHIQMLPPERRQEGESAENFAKRVQVVMATHLRLQPTTHTSMDKVEYTKRTLFAKKASTSTQRKQQPEAKAEEDGNSMGAMVKQVKEVLPHIPSHVIMNDLVMTKDVDLTITNILEGRAESASAGASEEKPKTIQVKPPVASTPKAAVEAPVSSTAASSFYPKSRDRHLSLVERKQALLDYARQKYREKHGIQ